MPEAPSRLWSVDLNTSTFCKSAPKGAFTFIFAGCLTGSAKNNQPVRGTSRGLSSLTAVTWFIVAQLPAGFVCCEEAAMHSIIYLVGLVVVVMFVLSAIGLH